MTDYRMCNLNDTSRILLVVSDVARLYNQAYTLSGSMHRGRNCFTLMLTFLYLFPKDNEYSITENMTGGYDKYESYRK